MASNNRLAPYIIKLRDEPYTDDLLSVDMQMNLSVFLIDLFWRNPSADRTAMELIQWSKMTWVDDKRISFEDPEREREYKNHPVFSKLERYKVHIESMKQITKASLPGYIYCNLWEFKNEPFVLGDFPIIFSKSPNKHTDLASLEHFLPISSNRLYACNRLEGLNFKRYDSLIINAIQIDQAMSFVVSPNSKILEESIRFYKAVKNDGCLPLYKKYLFNKL